jgi:CHASE2 domain-containing sensor protein
LRHGFSIRRALGIALLCWAVLCILDLLSAFASADIKMVDWRFQIRGPRPASDLVAMVVVDDATISAFGDRWPLPRSLHAALISALGEAGARAIGVDLLFIGPDPSDPASDTLLVLATKNEKSIVHAIAFPPEDPETEGSVPPTAMPLLERHGVAGPPMPIGHVGRVAAPFPELLEATPHLGHVNVAVDPDGVVRGVPLFLRYRDRVYPSLGLSLVQAAMENGKPPVLKPEHGGFRMAWPSGRSLFVPLDKEGATAIGFAGGRKAFPHTYSMLQVLQWSFDEEIDSLREAFHGRIVVVGATSMGHVATDLGTTPFEAATPLVYMHANVVNALVKDELLYRVAPAVRLLALAILALLVGYLAVVLPLPGAVLSALGASLAFAGIDFAFFLRGVDVPPTAGLILPPLVYTAVQSYRVVFEERRDRARGKELAIAARIQSGLLPRSRPSHPVLDVFGSNMPAQEVGGDYYDWIPVEEGGLAIAVGDVEGKGIGAALLMVHLHASFRAEARSRRTPGQVVEVMHRSLYEAAEARQFATFFLAFVDREARFLRYCSAGHNPGLHVRGKYVQWLEATGLPLGMILDGPAYEDREVALAPGDVVVLYSDGITEYEFRGELYGEERLAAVVTRLAATGKSASAMAQGILDDVRAFARGGPPSDDITLVVIRQSAQGIGDDTSSAG